MRIGLFGGSFNPPHDGHPLVEPARRCERLELDRVWWLVTPGNPLKDNAALPSLARTRRGCRSELADHPRIDVTGVRGELGIALHRRYARGL